MTKISMVLTGFEEARSFVRVDRIEDALSGKNTDFRPMGPATRFMIFNDGALKIPCDQETFSKILAYWKSARAKDSSVKPLRVVRGKAVTTDTSTDGADVFGGDIPPIPDDEDQEETNDETTKSDWSGAEDDGEDGVGQI